MRDEANVPDEPSAAHPTFEQGSNNNVPSASTSRTKTLPPRFPLNPEPNRKSASQFVRWLLGVTPPGYGPGTLLHYRGPETQPFFHAVFISGFPKLPCPLHTARRFNLGGTTMSIVIKYLAHQPRGLVWHPTCNRNGRAAVAGRPQFQAKRGVSAGRFSEAAGFLYPFRGRKSNFTHAPGVQGWRKQS